MEVSRFVQINYRSECGSRRPKNVWILLWMRIRNTAGNKRKCDVWFVLWFLGGQRTVTRPPHRHASWVAKQPRRNLELTGKKHKQRKRKLVVFTVEKGQ
jgi:hypothetical protein